MLWFFQRGDEYLRIETTHDAAAGSFALTVYQADGTHHTQLFGDQTAFERHLELSSNTFWPTIGSLERIAGLIPELAGSNR